MPSLQNVLVFLHVAFVMFFVLIHGASAVIAFRLRAERDPARVAPLLEASRDAIQGWPFPVALAGFVLTGIALGFMGGYWGSGWLWASIVILVVVIGGMTPMAANRLRRIRTAFGLEMPRGAAEEATSDPAAARTELDRWSPLPAAGLGGIGLLAILWLMMFKPF